MAGYTNSSGAGHYDFWLVKTDYSGNHQWNKTYGGANYDAALSVVETGDGGYALACGTRSFGAGGDAWLVKVAGPTPAPVGGIWVPVDKFGLLAPYIALTILLAVAVMTVGYVKKRKRI